MHKQLLLTFLAKVGCWPLTPSHTLTAGWGRGGWPPSGPPSRCGRAALAWVGSRRGSSSASVRKRTCFSCPWPGRPGRMCLCLCWNETREWVQRGPRAADFTYISVRSYEDTKFWAVWNENTFSRPKFQSQVPRFEPLRQWMAPCQRREVTEKLRFKMKKKKNYFLGRKNMHWKLRPLSSKRTLIDICHQNLGNKCLLGG